MDITGDWFWEGNVVEAVANHLANDGWRILSKADTRSKERGVDIWALKDSVELFVEAKGYPSQYYRDERRASAQKSTHPTNQAQQWYSHALLKALRLQTSHPIARVALAFPDFPRYRSLFAETSSGLNKLGIALFFVSEGNLVQELN